MDERKRSVRKQTTWKRITSEGWRISDIEILFADGTVLHMDGRRTRSVRSASFAELAAAGEGMSAWATNPKTGREVVYYDSVFGRRERGSVQRKDCSAAG